jgi:hypothetical protein
MSSTELETFINLWLSVKPYLNPKEKIEACEKFLNVVNEHICELNEVYDEWVGFDSTIDKVIRDNYVDYQDTEDYNEDDW